jgi:glucose-1-phosphate adenylyltransferase
VLAPGVKVGRGAVVRNSIVLTDTIIENGAIVDRAIVDKQCTIRQNAHVGYGVDYSPNPVGDLTSGISLLGKNAVIPENVRVGRNCVVAGDSQPGDFPGNMVPSGTTVGYVPKG